MLATVDERPSRLVPDRRARSRVARRITRWTLVRSGAVVAAVVAAVWAIATFGREYTFFDMTIYHGAMVWWTHGGDLYGFVSPGTTLGFTYPPFAALVMSPMAILPAAAAGWTNTIVSLTALTLLLAWLLVPIADRNGWPRWFVLALAVPLAAATEPVRETLGYGQVNLLLVALIYADFVALRNRTRASTRTPGEARRTGLMRHWWDTGAYAGVGVGLAAAIKLTPALFIAYFVITKQWRAALVSTVTGATVTILAFLIDGRETISYFTSVVFDTTRVGEVDATANQSLAGVLARLYDSPTTPKLLWLAFAMLLLAVGLSRASTAHLEGDELAAFTLVGLTGNAICPISWTHHMVFLIPALVVLGDMALRRRAAARGLAGRGMWSRGPVGIPALAGLRHGLVALGVYLLFVISPIWRYEHKFPKVSHYADGLHGALFENSLAFAVIALVALLPWRPGADPAFYPERGLARRAAALSHR